MKHGNTTTTDRSIEEYRKQRTKTQTTAKRLPRFKMGPVICGVLAIYFLVTFANLHYQKFVLDRKLSAAYQEIDNKKKTIAKLEDERIKLKDPQYLKELARTTYDAFEKREVYIKIMKNPGSEARK